MYTIEFSKLAEKKFNKLDKSIKKRTINKLKEIRRANKPRRFLESLKGVTARKLRVGDYRLIVDVEDENKVIYILTLGHRSEIYKELHKFEE